MIGQRQLESRKFVEQKMEVIGILTFINIVKIKFIVPVLFVSLRLRSGDLLLERKKEDAAAAGGVMQI
jgi:hypothetical protein